MAITRDPANYPNMLNEQYGHLRAGVEDYYSGHLARANDIAVRIRTLVHSTTGSRPLLGFMDANYGSLDIYHKPTSPKVVFTIKQQVQFSGDGTAKFVREDFTNPGYELVPLTRWWMEAYLVFGTERPSKKDIILWAANKDGGAHVDDKVPEAFAIASEPPVRFAVNDVLVSQPNLARSTVAQAGCELLNYIERHFAQ
jgi:hypothetical protein